LVAARQARSWPHRLSARSTNKVLLCEAGQDTPPGNEPPEIRDSYSGTAYFDPRFHWTELKVTTQVVSHNNPGEDRPPLRKYEQARVLGGRALLARRSLVFALSPHLTASKALA
jgi:hypothetical protein